MHAIYSYWYFDGNTYTVELGPDYYNKECNCFIVKRHDQKNITEDELKENDFNDVIITSNVYPEQDDDPSEDYRVLFDGKVYIPYYNGSILDPNPNINELETHEPYVVIVGKKHKDELVKPFCFIVKE